MRHLAVLVGSCMLLVACASPKQLVLSQPLVSQTSFRFTDARTAMSRAGVVDGDRTSYGDGNLKPAPPGLVSSWLHEALSEELQGKHVVLDNFDFGARSTFTSHPGLPAGTNAVHSLMAPTMVFLRIDGKVDGKSFSVGVNDRVNGPLTEDRLRAMLETARTELVREVRRAATGS